MRSPTVSICLPVYNGENYLHGAVESALDQTFRDLELLIVDDCSTDRTNEIARGFAAIDSRVKVSRNTENLGLFCNYNKCMEIASGEFIKLFAHDDIFEPTILERMLSVFERESDVALVSASKGWVDEDGHPLEPTSRSELKTMRPFQSDTRLKPEEAIGQTLGKMANWLGEPCSQMFRRRHVGSGFDTRFKQIGDLDFSYRLLAHGDYYYLCEPLCYFRKHLASHSQRVSRSLNAFLDWFVLGAKHKHHLPSAGLNEDEYCELLTRRLAGIFHETIYETGDETVSAVLHSFLGADSTPLSNFIAEEQSDRVNVKEFETMAVLGMVAVANLQQEMKLAQNQVEYNQRTIETIRQEISSVRQTLGNEVAELRGRLSEIGDSMSWKVTAPLRKCSGEFHKWRHGGRA
jgi:GT2 family glycosyltransferase